MLGMDVVLLDDREDYANPERFPYPCRVICGDFGEELERFPINANSYIVLVSRGHLVDELSLRRVAERGAGLRRDDRLQAAHPHGARTSRRRRR